MNTAEAKHYKGTKVMLDGYHAISRSLSRSRFRDYGFYFLMIAMVLLGGYWGLKHSLRKPAEAVASNTGDIGNIVKNSMQEIRTELTEIPETINRGFKGAKQQIENIEEKLNVKIDDIANWIKGTCVVLGLCAIAGAIKCCFFLLPK